VDHGPSLVLFLHDATDLDFSGHKTLQHQLGQIGDGGGRGWICHNTIGLAPVHKRWIHVADRQQRFVIRSSSNRVLVLDDDADGPPQLVLQSDDTSDDAVSSAIKPHLLHDRMRTLPTGATWAVQVGAQAGRRARAAMVQASGCPMLLKPPHVRKGDFRTCGLGWEAI